MIDTIKLAIPQSMYTIIDHHKFNPPTYEMFNAGLYSRGGLSFSTQNPTTDDKRNGIYKPRLTVVRRPLKGLGYQNTLYAELSLPKLIYGNNFDELTSNDFDLVIAAIKNVLKDMGVMVLSSQLPDAHLSAIHFGKNFILDDFTTPYTYISELKKIDFSKVLDINQTDYRNGGLNYKIHSNLFEFAFYDKLKELQQSKLSPNRSIDDDDYCQLSLLDYIEKLDQKSKPFEVLRLEMRLNNRRCIKKTLKKSGLNENTTFRSLFDQSLAKKLLMSYFDQMLEQYIPVYENSSPLYIFNQLKIDNPLEKPAKLLELATAQSIIGQTSVREFRNMINDKNWYRLKKNLQIITVSKHNNYLYRLRDQLDTFKKVRLIDYPQLMLNDVN